jgi:hypothetical protein
VLGIKVGMISGARDETSRIISVCMTRHAVDWGKAIRDAPDRAKEFSSTRQNMVA